MPVKRASSAGFFAIFIESAFGGATGVVVAVVVVVVVVEPDPVVEPLVVVDDAVTVAFLPLPLPALAPWAFGAWVLGPFAGAEPFAPPPPALPCETVVVGAFGAFAEPPPLPCAAAPVTPTDAMVSAAANV
jgi:hypothetical protein